MASLLLPALRSKRDVDAAIRHTEDRVLVLRFGRADDPVCLQLDHLLAKAAPLVVRMAAVYTVDVDRVGLYAAYFDISLIPATLFFFNGQHLKADYGTQDHSKWIGCFHTKQDFIDLVEVFYRGAQRGKLIVTSPIAREHVPPYTLLYRDL